MAKVTEKLTKFQREVLHKIAVSGERTYNGRMRRTIKALEAAGLVDVDWDKRAQTKGNGIELVDVITVRLKGNEG